MQPPNSSLFTGPLGVSVVLPYFSASALSIMLIMQATSVYQVYLNDFDHSHSLAMSSLLVGEPADSGKMGFA